MENKFFCCTFTIMNNTSVFKKYEGTREDYNKLCRTTGCEGYTLLGLLEWTNPDYYEYPKSHYGSEDFLWVKTITTDVSIYSRYAIGSNPLVGNNYIFKGYFTLISFLKWMICSSEIICSRPINGRVLIEKIPEGIRLQGMPEFIKREKL